MIFNSPFSYRISTAIPCLGLLWLMVNGKWQCINIRILVYRWNEIEFDPPIPPSSHRRINYCLIVARWTMKNQLLSRRLNGKLFLMNSLLLCVRWNFAIIIMKIMRDFAHVPNVLLLPPTSHSNRTRSFQYFFLEFQVKAYV